MASVTEKVRELDQQAKDYEFDEKAEAKMKKRWDQLKHRKPSNRPSSEE